MLSQTGHPIKKDALVAIMDHFNIDATNPVICLTQARSQWPSLQNPNPAACFIPCMERDHCL